MVSMTSTIDFARNLIRQFAKHYAIPLADARECWREGAGNWARAFDALVRMYKCEVK